MDYNGFRFNNLYKEAERDVIDDLKDEVVCLKKKIKHCKYREEDLEEEISDLSQKKDKLEKDIERIMNESAKSKRNCRISSSKKRTFIAEIKNWTI